MIDRIAPIDVVLQKCGVTMDMMDEDSRRGRRGKAISDEVGPEAIIPLERGPDNNLGVSNAAGEVVPLVVGDLPPVTEAEEPAAQQAAEPGQTEASDVTTLVIDTEGVLAEAAKNARRHRLALLSA